MLVPAVDELLYEKLGVSREVDQKGLAMAFRKDQAAAAAPEEDTKALAKPLFAGGTLVGERAVGWVILLYPHLRILYHIVGYPLVHLVHMWLQSPDWELEKLQLVVLIGAIVAHEQHSNSCAIRNYWQLLTYFASHIPACYAALLQGALLVLE